MEVVGGLIAAEQVISTAVEGGAVAGYAIQKKTLPLKATFSCMGSTPKGLTQDASPDSLARSSHSLNILDGDGYIFGGKVSKDTIAGNEMHILKLSNLGGLGPQYKAVPALARDGDDIPAARAGHTACVIDGKIVMFGGYGSVGGKPLEEGGRVWLFDPTTLQWSRLDVANERFPQRCEHAAVAHGNKLIIHGGYSGANNEPETDTWSFDLESRTWVELPSLHNPADAPAMLARAPPNLAIANGALYLVAGSSDLGSEIHSLDVEADPPATEWSTIQFPTNPLTPGPRPRKGAGLLPVTTGMGRTYLIFMLGEKDDPHAGTTTEPEAANEEPEYWSGFWAVQIPSTENTPAHAKDVARDKLNLASREAEWAEVQVVPSEVEDVEHGKAHPGPRGYFGCDQADGNKLVLWGGVNPNGDMEGDGWIIELST